jgi:P-type Cu+ transporter
MGSCPICGMALEPETPSAVAGANSEVADMMRGLWIGAILALPVVMLEMAGHLVGRFALSQQPSNWIQLVLATPVVIWAGYSFLNGVGARSFRATSMLTLISRGTGAAWIYGMRAAWRPPISRRPAAAITVLVLVGQVLELRAREQTSGAIRAFLDLAPKTARH